MELGTWEAIQRMPTNFGHFHPFKLQEQLYKHYLCICVSVYASLYVSVYLFFPLLFHVNESSTEARQASGRCTCCSAWFKPIWVCFKLVGNHWKASQGPNANWFNQISGSLINGQKCQFFGFPGRVVIETINWLHVNYQVVHPCQDHCQGMEEKVESSSALKELWWLDSTSLVGSCW